MGRERLQRGETDGLQNERNKASNMRITEQENWRYRGLMQRVMGGVCKHISCRGPVSEAQANAGGCFWIFVGAWCRQYS